MDTSFICVGDISFGDSARCTSFGIRSTLEKEPQLDIFQHIKKHLRSGDVVFGNLEVVLSDSGLNRNKLSSLQMRGKKTFIKHIVEAGFNVLNIANNHILQHGEEAFWETIRILKENNIQVVGLATENGLNCQPVYIEKNNKKIVFLGYCFESEKYYTGTTLYALGDENAIIQDLRSVKDKSAFVICSLHWGKEFINYPSNHQMNFARQLIDNGCDLILGHHPHVIQGYEEYKNKYIFYSLGNFLFDMMWNKDCQKSIVIKLILNNEEFAINKISPVTINNKYQPSISDKKKNYLLLDNISSKIIKNFQQPEDKYLKTYLEYEKKNRYASWRYMLKNLHKYRITILCQLIFTALKRRLTF